jgi:hypothetical protein
MIEKRFEIIKIAIALGDVDVIESQISKIKLHSLNADEVAILHALENDQLSDAHSRIKTYLSTDQRVVLFEDMDLNALVMEKNELQMLVDELRFDRDELIDILDRFQYAYQDHVGSILCEILLVEQKIQEHKLKEKSIKFNELREEYEAEQAVLNNRKIEKERLEKEMESLDPFDNADEHAKLEEEVEALEVDIKSQKQKVKECLNKAKKEQDELTSSQEKKHYEEAKHYYSEFTREYEEVLDNQRFKLNSEQENELKKLYRQAAKLCHPDVVNEKSKEIATAFMTSVNEAKKTGDIVGLRSLLEELKKGVEINNHKHSPTNREKIAEEIEIIRQEKQALKFEIEEIQSSDEWSAMPSVNEWDDYFEGLITELQSELSALKLDLESLDFR